MKRIQLFEFEDFPWFPSWMRSSMTNLIVVLHKLMGTKEVLAELLLSIRKSYPFESVIDIGSGSGGIMPSVIQFLNKSNNKPINLELSDLYPNKEYIDFINEQKLDHIRYRAEALDARMLSNSPAGLKTMINSFHHMTPQTAKEILRSAQENKQPLLIYEIAENKIPLFLWWILLPFSLSLVFIMALLMTPFSKPLTLKQLIFTYLIPIIPFCYAWDGQASLPRMYTFKDIEFLLKDSYDPTYLWTMQPARSSTGKKLGYYILGTPK